ncbi:ABC transporter permease [Candidatus Bipolaricaulota bacterium]|nr:ABC transporter permease [Candidatus Bipolaricaulota bacterium]MCK5586899.1 ABC transporter permease [Candidatus Bipolaricaulota bacterium]
MSFSDIISLLRISLHAMVPLALTAVGEIVGETAGLFNIGLEGILLLSAFAGAIGAEAGGPYVGLLVGMGVGGVMSLLFATINTYWKGTQMVTGIGINLFAMGFVAFGLIQLGAPGFHDVPRAVSLFKIRTPIGMYSPVILLALVLPFVIHWFLKRTRAGLMLKAAGEMPEAADVAGININRIRLLAAVFGGAMAGLAGAYMSVAWLGLVTKGLSAGRGFIALACVVFSGLNPLLALLAAFIFGFFQALAEWVKTLPSKPIPGEFVSMLPYIVTLLVVSGAIGRVRFPKFLGVPYKRE